MSDGVRLAASLYVPDGDGPWPAVLEALPYRKDDDTAGYQVEYERLAAAGYVVCRVDLRGTGSSEGIAEDEYPAVERTDMMTVIDWLATQAWSTGAVGMYGTSYSGFNSIQLAMERPPGAEGDHPDLRDRRSVRGRRPLLRRRGEAARPGRLPDVHDRA